MSEDYAAFKVIGVAVVGIVLFGLHGDWSDQKRELKYVKRMEKDFKYILNWIQKRKLTEHQVRREIFMFYRGFIPMGAKETKELLISYKKRFNIIDPGTQKWVGTFHGNLHVLQHMHQNLGIAPTCLPLWVDVYINMLEKEEEISEKWRVPYIISDPKFEKSFPPAPSLEHWV